MPLEVRDVTLKSVQEEFWDRALRFGRFFFLTVLQSAGPQTHWLFLCCKTSGASEHSRAPALRSHSGDVAAILPSPGRAHLTPPRPAGQHPPPQGGPVSPSRQLPSRRGGRAVFRRGSSSWKVAAGGHGCFSALPCSRRERSPPLAPLRASASQPAPPGPSERPLRGSVSGPGPPGGARSAGARV